ncbi:hypothetical protein SAMN05421823_108246 [Catalinimonas alkaloidigena]|uniref:Nucleoid-associated protein SAMN05421823_108246 n=1 Tax=Catalinimonas alkaloidigena TaxID=1075417 RepID=A0A1G9ND69_9BACT|nr:YbaB/EbfC family nucleoid-associated protein [Catalinimonas alkaloidigena]SDL84067.1 hypothetical protein SAMN05421823_108246 [Catalinimonas alkaloidigena]
MFDLNKMMGQFKEAQTKMQELQEEIAVMTTSAEAGAGMVKVTVNGRRQIVSLEIDPDLVKPDDREMLQDLVVAAVNKALADMETIAKDEMQKRASSMFNIPGLNLGGGFPF